MIVWGAIWGALISVLVSRHSGDWEWVIGAILGSLAGWTLRKAVRNEVARLAKQPPSVDATVAAAATTPAQAPGDVVAATVASAQPLAAPMEGAPLETTTRVPAQPVQQATTAEMPGAAGATPEAPDVAALAAPDEPKAPAPPNAIDTLIARAKDWLLGGNTVARVGAIVLFIGLSFLAKWAADNALFPPEARLAAIGLVGIALLVQGFRLWRANTGGEATAVRSNYALLLQGAGVAVLYLTVFAAFKLYAMIPPLAAFVLMAVVCALSTLLALLANAQSLALVGFAGAFATPILISTGQGNHVALFSYYLMLNLAIGVVAWLRAWRALNLLGFLSTFIVATLWGALKYAPEHYASTQPFLFAFFVIYVVIGLAYALRHSGEKGHTLDGMLIFGTPIVAFALQTQLVAHIEYGAAISAIVLSFIYVLLAYAMRARSHPIAHWLMLSYASLALIFATLAVPLAVDGRLTAAIWAIEGAGVFWLSLRQKRWMGQAFGAAMQLLAAAAFTATYDHQVPAVRAFANSHFVGTLMLALGSLAISWWTYVSSRDQHRSATSDSAGADGGASPDTTLVDAASVLFFLTGFAWALFGLWTEVLSSALSLRDVARFAWVTFSFVALAFSAFLIWKRTGWTSARFPAVVVLPFLILCAGVHLVMNTRASLYFDLLLWPACFALHLVMLRGVDALSPQRWRRIVHAGNMLLLILLIGGFLYRVVNAAGLQHTDWAAVILLFASALVMMALASGRVWSGLPSSWPLDRFQREYAVHAGLGVAILTTMGALIVACTARGDASPLPYLPLLNPVDLCAFLALASVALWFKQLRASTLVDASSSLRSGVALGLLAFAAFIVVNTVWLRFAHHFRGIAWNSSALADSFFVQAGYSMLWTLLGVGAMVLAHRKAQRAVWQAGAALLALTVVKLLVVDLENSGGGERIVAFIGVGILMVAVGYFAPMPPAAPKAERVVPAEVEHEKA
jgi:uncharacterized membrane protein